MHFYQRSISYPAAFVLCFLINLCSLRFGCNAEIQLARNRFSNRADESPPSSSSSRKRHTNSLLPSTDKNLIKAAKLFMNNDNISLGQAMGRHGISDKGTDTSAGASQPLNSKPFHPSGSDNGIKYEIQPFSSGVMRNKRKKGPRPAKYDSNQQVAARHAERLLSSGEVKDDRIALEMGKAKVMKKQNYNLNLHAKWREMANSDPSQAREMKLKVPLRLSRNHYVLLRAHQLDHQGKANGMEDATQIAIDEHKNEAARKHKQHRDRVLKSKS